MNQIDVALALIARDTRCLVCRRAPGRIFAGLWEFPGGKIKPGESPANAAVRETREEVGLEVRAGRLLPAVTTHHAGMDVILHPVLCHVDTGELTVLADAVDASRWVTREELSCLEMPPANAAIIAALPELRDS